MAGIYGQDSAVQLGQQSINYGAVFQGKNMGYRTTKNGTGQQITQEQVEQLFAYLTEGTLPEGCTARHPRLSKRKAFSVIWYLQEILEVLPDFMDQCCKCGDLFNSEREGHVDEKSGREYCDNCTGYVR